MTRTEVIVGLGRSIQIDPKITVNLAEDPTTLAVTGV
jgi:hypothetical protein